ncbi:MAG TPA: cobalamin-binding domain-containing protein [Chromatiaceae bacterium]|jgi:hypothetical protein|nr:cobalamin-binding domain-containing protein [Chromatiaceae bacterium]HBH29938.1 cobalamin-binding domain-containing protein [Desulfofustis sp.]
MRRVLLVEPGYKNKYPPLGLMKLSSYHKLMGDEVHFVKGCVASFRETTWDRIYVSTLFTFFWSATMQTVKYYLRAVRSPENLIVGGVMATLLQSDIEKATGVRVLPGLLDRPGILDSDSTVVVDGLIPDYQILESIEYEYPVRDAYIAYATRGCPNRCGFCAVNKIEPTFRHYCPLPRQVKGIEDVYGPKQDLILLDNNVLASRSFKRIIGDIRHLGFERGATLNGRMRRVDFNQGVDARKLTDKKMALLATTAIRPLRIAFDHISMRDLYVSRVRLAAKHEVLNLSNYVLYNYTDTPSDFYQRLRINCELNEELGTQIYSFPMKYIPLTARNRSHVGPNWNRKLIRGVQCILLATRGMVSPRLEFFEAAFGRTPEEFETIALMPNEYIIHRRLHENNGAAEWVDIFHSLTKPQRRVLYDIHADGRVTEAHYKRTTSPRFRRLLEHYIEADRIEAARRT